MSCEKASESMGRREGRRGGGSPELEAAPLVQLIQCRESRGRCQRADQAEQWEGRRMMSCGREETGEGKEAARIRDGET